jgi:UDP-N-acetyl-D-glucosamine dehydrogenase
MSKLIENTFRFINISFINEMALLCDRLGINIWEVIEAASSKPFAFMSHYPSAGVGGHCIPVVPLYLEAIAQQQGMAAQLIQVSAQINDEMPRMIVRKIAEALEERGDALQGARILLLGVTYKADIADTRESAALRVFEHLVEQCAEVSYHDPYIPSVTVAGQTYETQTLDPEFLRTQDCAVVLTPHAAIDFAAVISHTPLVLDTRSGLVPHSEPNVINVWRPREVRIPSPA